MPRAEAAAARVGVVGAAGEVADGEVSDGVDGVAATGSAAEARGVPRRTGAAYVAGSGSPASRDPRGTDDTDIATRRESADPEGWEGREETPPPTDGADTESDGDTDTGEPSPVSAAAVAAPLTRSAVPTPRAAASGPRRPMKSLAFISSPITDY